MTLDLLRSAAAPILSLDAARGDPDDPPLEDVIAAEPDEWPAAAVDRGSLSAALAEALPAIPARERLVLELRFGLLGSDEQTLQEVGRRLGLSRERVRQIEARALERLRRRPALARVATLLDGGRAAAATARAHRARARPA
jgi:RNA polymerase primary sigma factor